MNQMMDLGGCILLVNLEENKYGAKFGSLSRNPHVLREEAIPFDIHPNSPSSRHFLTVAEEFLIVTNSLGLPLQS